MKYFVINLIVHVLVFIALTVMMLVFASRNKRRKTRHGIVFFAPCLFAILAVADMLFFAGPRILDIRNVAADNYSIHSGALESVSSLGNVVVIGGETFYINPKAEIPTIGSDIKVKYTDNAKYIMEMSANQPVTVEETFEE